MVRNLPGIRSLQQVGKIAPLNFKVGLGLIKPFKRSLLTITTTSTPTSFINQVMLQVKSFSRCTTTTCSLTRQGQLLRKSSSSNSILGRLIILSLHFTQQIQSCNTKSRWMDFLTQENIAQAHRSFSLARR